jgi:putative transposase
MPACARREIVREGERGIFHCWSRCCRRAYLLGNDPLTGKNHDHRRQWITERLQLLVANFVVDVCGRPRPRFASARERPP